MNVGTGLTIGFSGYADPEHASKAHEFEDAVLALLPDHGANVLFRGCRATGQGDHLPLEMHVLWFPDERAFQSYLNDPRRSAILAQFGEVFSTKHAVELTPRMKADALPKVPGNEA